MASVCRGGATSRSWVAAVPAGGTGRPARTGIADLAQAAPHPTRDLVACTADLPARARRRGRSARSCWSAPGRVRRLLPDSVSGSPVWSPDGTRLCVLASASDARLASPVVLDAGRASRSPAPATSAVRPSAPAGRRTAPGWRWWSPSPAPRSPTSGGPAPSAAAAPSPGARASSRGRAADAGSSCGTSASGEHRARSPTSTSGRPTGWATDLVALVSERADEGAWYDARLVRVRLDGDGRRPARGARSSSRSRPDRRTARGLVGADRLRQRPRPARGLAAGRPRGRAAVRRTHRGRARHRPPLALADRACW